MRPRMISGADRQRRRRLSWLIARAQQRDVPAERSFGAANMPSAPRPREDPNFRSVHDDDESAPEIRD